MTQRSVVLMNDYTGSNGDNRNDVLRIGWYSIEHFDLRAGC